MRVKLTMDDIRKSACGKLNGHILNPSNSGSLKDKRRPKYGNKKVEWEGLVFDSKKEYNRYRELLILLKLGKIGQLERQIEYKLEVDGEKVASYFADHRFIWTDTGNLQVEDVKSEPTRKKPVYRLKKKLMKAIYGIEIVEV